MKGDILTVVRLDLGLLFLMASASKLLNPLRFVKGVVEYDILPYGAAKALGVLLIPLEALLAVAHITGWLLSFASLVGMITLLMFGAAVSVNLIRRREILCYCFGAGDDELLSRKTLARVVILVLGEAVLFRSLILTGSSQLLFAQPVATIDLLSGYLPWIALSVVLLMWCLDIPEMIELVRGQHCGTCSREATSVH